MKESHFIDQNTEKWANFKNAVSARQKDPGLLSKLFIQITDDLSFARTFYPNRTIRKYLNGLAESLFINLNSTKKEQFSDFVLFWKTSLPLMNYQARKEFLVSFIIFTAAFIIGFISSSNDPAFASFILGEDYVSTTVENIKNNDPMAVYKKFLPIEGFFSITINNLFVAAYTFVFGAFSALGTVFILLYNGVMIGSFQEFFTGQGLFKVSFLTIWQHGAIEVSSIIIAGAAGLTLGKGMLFPGTYTRFQSFRIGAGRGLKMFSGIVPPIILAGFIESFLTRHTELPDALRLAFILISLSLMLLYYVWYPVKVARKHGTDILKKEKIGFVEKPKLVIDQVYSANQLFENTMILITSGTKRYIRPLLVIAILGSVLTIYFVSGHFTIAKGFWTDFRSGAWPLYLHYKTFPQIFLLNAIAFAVVLFIFIKPLAGLKFKKPGGVKFKRVSRAAIISITISILINVLFFIGFWPAYLISILIFPVLMMVAFVFVNQQVGIFRATGNGIRYFIDESRKTFELSFKFGFLLIVFILLISRFVDFSLDFVLPYFDISTDHYFHVRAVIEGSLFLFVHCFGIGLIVSSIGLLYFSARESQTADNLLMRIDNFGGSKKLLGYERE